MTDFHGYYMKTNSKWFFFFSFWHIISETKASSNINDNIVGVQAYSVMSDSLQTHEL